MWWIWKMTQVLKINIDYIILINDLRHSPVFFNFTGTLHPSIISNWNKKFQIWIQIGEKIIMTLPFQKISSVTIRQLSIHGNVGTSFWWLDVPPEANQLGIGKRCRILANSSVAVEFRLSTNTYLIKFLEQRGNSTSAEDIARFQRLFNNSSRLTLGRTSRQQHSHG